MPGMPMASPGGALIRAAPQGAPPKEISMDDLPFSSKGHKAMWESIFDLVNSEMENYLKQAQHQPQSAFGIPKLPMPSIHDMQIEMVFGSYDMEKTGELSLDRIKDLMRDMQCVSCLAMSKQKGEALQEARNEITQMMGPQFAHMLSAQVSQAMDFELQMLKQLSSQEVPDKDAKELQKELDADGDGVVSKDDFLKNAKKALFDPNPPEEVMEAMKQAEAMMMGGGPCQMMMGPGGPLAIGPGGPCGGMPPGAVMSMDVMVGPNGEMVMGPGMPGGGVMMMSGPMPGGLMGGPDGMMMIDADDIMGIVGAMMGPGGPGMMGAGGLVMGGPMPTGMPGGVVMGGPVPGPGVVMGGPQIARGGAPSQPQPYTSAYSAVPQSVHTAPSRPQVYAAAPGRPQATYVQPHAQPTYVRR